MADQLVLIGTYTASGKSKGIYSFALDDATGKMTPIGLAAEVRNPSFLAIHPSRRFVYAVNEVADAGGQRSGAVTAFSLQAATGKLELINSVPTKGAGPCHLTVDRTGKYLVVVNYGGGSTAFFPIRSDGGLEEATAFYQHEGKSVNPRRQERPHAHSVNISANNRFAIVADLGLDQLLVYRLDASKGTFTPHNPPYLSMTPGAGPRHFAFHPKRPFAYAINELASTITALRWDEGKGVLQKIAEVSTLPAGYKGDTTTAEVVVHPSGRFVYGSNRGHDSIAVFRVNEKDGSLTLIEHTSTQGRTPRNFAIDLTGRWLIAANQSSDNLVVFSIDSATGKLTPTGQVLEAGSPVCVRFVRR